MPLRGDVFESCADADCPRRCRLRCTRETVEPYLRRRSEKSLTGTGTRVSRIYVSYQNLSVMVANVL